jgi:protein SCO1/2
MGEFLHKPFNLALVGLGLLVAAMTAFVVFQPVQVIPRLAYGPEFELDDQTGSPVTDKGLEGNILLYGFGYTSDPTVTIEETLADMNAFQAAVAAADFETEVSLALILFDDRRDTSERRRAFAEAHRLDLSNWYLLGGEERALKDVIGLGFGVYYEAVPLPDLLENQVERLSEQPAFAPEVGSYGYLQAQRYVLVDERNFIRAEYKGAPLDLELAMRDIEYIIREKNSTGAARALNEAAHLFLCYPQ